MASSDQLARLKAVVPAAQLGAQLYGVPASVTLAQWILESGWGTTGLATKANNCFGIKHAQKNLAEAYMEFPTHEYVSGKLVLVEANFVKYASVADSFKAHAALLAKSSRYANAMAVAHVPSAFAIAIQRCGYSTNPDYAKELLKLIDCYDLTQYDTTPPEEPALAMEKAA